jgi:HEAT repeat protein
MNRTDRPASWRFAATARGPFLLVLTLVLTVASEAPAVEPVEQLRQVLRTPCYDVAARDQAIKDGLAALRTPADLRRALALTEWRDRHPDEDLAACDRTNKAVLTERFVRLVRAVLRRGDPEATLATLDLLTEMAGTARANGDPPGPAAQFGSDLALLMRTGPQPVRGAAARTLGQIDPELSSATQALGELLTSTDPAQRQAAVEGLEGLLQSVTQAAARPGTSGAGRAHPRDVVETAVLVLPVVGRGLNDWHPGVRRHAVGAVGLTAASLARMISDPIAADAVAGPDGQLLRQEVAAERARLRPLILALRQQGPALVQAMRDDNVEDRLQTAKALEELAHARVRWLRQQDAVGSSDEVDDPLLLGLRIAIPVLADLTADSDLRLRRTALDVLELLGPLAVPAAPALARALNDRDRFVRWAAVRTLGGLGPSVARTALPSLTRLLQDPDLDVRLAAATALERVSPKVPAQVITVGAPEPVRSPSGNTLPALLRSLKTGDPEIRVAAIHAIQGMEQDARPVTPALREALSDADPRVRRAAAEALGALGPLAGSAVEDLRRTLKDSQADVRRAAGDALLNILGAANVP